MNTGAELFARYAYPPNALGYCGPADASWSDAALRTEVAAEVLHAVTQFEGAWPYLELIGGLHGLSPLHKDVVEAYWVGNQLLDHVDLLTWGNSVTDRFAGRAGQHFDAIDAAIGDSRPNHAFHVFCVYPWVGLLRAGNTGPSLEVIDRCRIRSGEVVTQSGSTAVVMSDRITWDGRFLSAGPLVAEQAQVPASVGTLKPGAIVTLHWDYVCDVIDHQRQRRLLAETERHLALVNSYELSLT